MGQGVRRFRVILAAHGEAPSAGLRENFRVSWHTLAHAAEVIPLPAPLRLAISGAGAVRKRLAGGPGSPHNANTREQASALQAQLADVADGAFHVQAAFASCPPYLEDTILARGDAERQLILSMIPTDSRLSCGLACYALRDVAPELRERTTILARLWDDSALIALQRDHIVARFPSVSPARNSCLVLVLHGTIVRDSKGCPPGFHTGASEKDAYGDSLRSALLAVPNRPWQRVELAYLNHGVGGEWSRPTLPELLPRLASEGVDCVVAYPCEHLVEGTETLGLSTVLAASAIAETHALECLNTSTAFIDYLADLVRAAVAAENPSRCCDCCPLART